MNIKMTIEWQMQRFNLTREEAEEKIAKIKENRSNRNKLRLNVDYQMQKFGLTREEAEEKIAKIRKSYGSARPKSVEWQMQKFGLTREEAEAKVNDINSRTGNAISKTRKEHPEQNSSNKEFWLKKGYSEEDAIAKVNEKMENMRNAFKKALKENPEKYKGFNPTQLEYWLKKGYSEKDAKTKLKERQTTFTLEKCIKKYGEEAGTLIYEERQRNWSAKIEAKYRNGEFSKMPKPSENGTPISGAEKIFIDAIHEKYTFKEDVYDYTTSQFMIRHSNGAYYYDLCYKNKIVEFNGDYWHCNPQIYEENYFHLLKNSSAKEIWEYDERKIKFANDKGYEVLVIWENEFNKNPKTTIEKVIQFLNK